MSEVTRRRQDTEPEARLWWDRDVRWVPAVDASDPADRRFGGRAWTLLLITFSLALGVQLGLRDCSAPTHSQAGVR